MITGDDIKKWIIDSASHFGISENEVLALNLVTDGVRKDGIKIEGFQNCQINLLSLFYRYHSGDNSGTSKIENLTEWVLNPTNDMKEKLTEMELAELHKCEEQIDHFCEIGRFVKRTTVGFGGAHLHSSPFSESLFIPLVHWQSQTFPKAERKNPIRSGSFFDFRADHE